MIWAVFGLSAVMVGGVVAMIIGANQPTKDKPVRQHHDDHHFIG